MRSGHLWEPSKEELRPEDFATSGNTTWRDSLVDDWCTMPSDEFEARHPLTARPNANQLNRRIARALLPLLRTRPSENELQDKPIELRLSLPLPPALKFYAFTATQHEAERQRDTYKIQLTHVPRFPERARWKFSREAGVRPILIGFVPSLDVFITSAKWARRRLRLA